MSLPPENPQVVPEVEPEYFDLHTAARKGRLSEVVDRLNGYSLALKDEQDLTVYEVAEAHGHLEQIPDQALEEYLALKAQVAEAASSVSGESVIDAPCKPPMPPLPGEELSARAALEELTGEPPGSAESERILREHLRDPDPPHHGMRM